MNKAPCVVASTLWIRGLRYSDKEYIYDILSDVGYLDSFIDEVLNWLRLREISD